ncbi:hypothetical protein F4805DRAFT_440806 [Annulohypoxylon moriforme]|nr:hypothetical protein F4805DRAFT_440806 [Annulohypoxylon moriforme]
MAASLALPHVGAALGLAWPRMVGGYDTPRAISPLRDCSRSRTSVRCSAGGKWRPPCLGLGCRLWPFGDLGRSLSSSPRHLRETTRGWSISLPPTHPPVGCWKRR